MVVHVAGSPSRSHWNSAATPLWANTVARTKDTHRQRGAGHPGAGTARRRKGGGAAGGLVSGRGACGTCSHRGVAKGAAGGEAAGRGGFLSCGAGGGGAGLAPRTAGHVGDGADGPAREITIEGGCVHEHCAAAGGTSQRSCQQSKVVSEPAAAKRGSSCLCAGHRGAGRSLVRHVLLFMSVTALTSQPERSPLKASAW
eukprot:SAG22_NODE_1614_length_3993_cov_3.572419_2_plen_199_part_00